MKKSAAEKIVEVVPAKVLNLPGVEKNTPSKKIPRKKVSTQHWQPVVKVWFDLFAELVPPPPGEEKAVPCFDTIDTAQLKIILRDIRDRCEKKKLEWTEENAVKFFDMFIRRAWTDDFTSRNFMLKIISSRRGLIFNNQITHKKNGTGTTKGNSDVGKTIKFDRP